MAKERRRPSYTRPRPVARPTVVAATMALFTAGLGCAAAGNVLQIATAGDSRMLRERPEAAPPSSPSRPALLLLALDGVDRDLLYDLLRRGELPGFAALLSGQGTS